MEVLKKINELGYEALIVGGTPRDLLLGKEISDVDIATSAPIQELEKHFKNHDIGKNKDFNVIVIDVDGYSFEVAAYRSDVYDDYSKGVGATKTVIAKDFKSDSARRDFGMNSLGVDVDGNIQNHWGGVQDIQNKIVKAVGNPNDRFKEDMIRPLRAIRQASKLGFSIDKDTLDSIKSQSPQIQKVANERILKELWKMSEQNGEKFAQAIIMLKDVGLLQYILPEVFQLKDFKHSEIHHPEGERDLENNPTVWGHTIEALKANKEADALVNWAILLHDLGKSKTHAISDKGTHSYYGHAEQSGKMIEEIGKRLKMDNKTIEAIKWVAESHMKFHNILDMNNSTIMKLMNSPYFDILKSVAYADEKARGNLFNAEQWDKIEQKILKLQNQFNDKQSINSLRKTLNGTYIMNLRPDIKPGPKLGEIIKATLDYVLNNPQIINNEEDIKQFILKY